MSTASQPRLGGMFGFLTGASAMFATMYATQAILPTIGRDFDVSPSRAGLTISTVVMAMVVGAWLWGPLSDRVGRRLCLITASAVLVPATFFVAVAPTFESLLTARALQGLILPGLLVVGLPYVSEVFIPRVGARAMGWYMASLISGGLIGRVGVALVTAATNWRIAMALLATFPLAAVVVMRRTLPEAPPRHAGAKRGRLANRRVIAASMSGPALFFVFVAVFSFIGYRLEGEPFGLSPTQTALVFAVWVAGSVAPIAGRRVERHGWSAIALLGTGVAACGVLLTWGTHLSVVILGLTGVTLGMFTVVTAAPIGVGGATGVRPGAASALYYSIYYSAGAIGAFLPGLAWEHGGWSGVIGTCAVALALATAGGILGRADQRGWDQVIPRRARHTASRMSRRRGSRSRPASSKDRQGNTDDTTKGS